MSKTTPSAAAPAHPHDYNVQHSPMGAFSSFTIGSFGKRGGLASQIGRPGPSNVFIGYQEEGREARVLPFYHGSSDNREAYAVEGAAGEGAGSGNAGAEKTVAPGEPPPLRALAGADFDRRLGWATDEWTSGPLRVLVYSPFFVIPDPATASAEELKRASCPVGFVTLSFDNRKGAKTLRGLFASDANQTRDLDSTSNGELLGMASLNRLGFAAKRAEGVASFLEFTASDGLVQAGKRLFRLGKTGGLVFEVPAGERREFTVAFGFFNPGIVTTGLETSYWYCRYFQRLEEVLAYGLDHFDFYRQECEARDRELEQSRLNPSQKWLLAQATHSYWGSTQWLDRGGKPLWVVNEGEYEMINTFDLTVDQVFFEMRFVPWAVRNELELFVERYSYYDEIHRFGGDGKRYTGGISFCHDQGISSQFTPFSHSSYEVSELPAKCFSYMTHEQLTNWICCAGVYFSKSRDRDFLRRYQGILADCLMSLLNRDHPDPNQRNGVMGFDSSRTGSGAEITTYDSLDASLGQARNNLYLAGKTWASYVILEHLFWELGLSAPAQESALSAARCAKTIASHWNDKLGYIPAVFENDNTSAIIPAIEGLVYPAFMGLDQAVSESGPYGDYIRILKRHFEAVFRPGLCLFDDQGWKLSSTSNNSWMSKIAISQHVARKVLGIGLGAAGEAQDAAHVQWQKVGSGYWACSDQFVSGEAKGSKYYPRIVTAVLWLEE